MNEHSAAVGYFDTPNGDRKPVLFPASDSNGATSGIAIGIAEDGIVIGNATLTDGSTLAFVFFPGERRGVVAQATSRSAANPDPHVHRLSSAPTRRPASSSRPERSSVSTRKTI